VVLITSFTESEGKNIWNGQDYNFEREIAKTFESRFDDSGYKTLVLHKASLEEFNYVLTSPATYAVFIVLYPSQMTFPVPKFPWV
jgi:hypothetical protein